MCVQIHTVCELTHGVQNYTVVPFAYNMKKFPSLEFFTLTPWLAWLTNMRYAFGRPTTERPLRVSVSLPIPPLSCLLPWRTGGLLSGWVEASLGATLHGDCFIANQKLISLSCAQTELKLLLSTARLKIKPKLLIQFLTPPLSLSYSLYYGVPLKVRSLAHYWQFNCLTNISPYLLVSCEPIELSLKLHRVLFECCSKRYCKAGPCTAISLKFCHHLKLKLRLNVWSHPE